MLHNLTRGVVAALTLAIAVAASGVAQAHPVHHYKAHSAAPRTDYLRYSYRYHPIIGYSLYGNCYWVEDFAPYRPHLIRECPGR